MKNLSQTIVIALITIDLEIKSEAQVKAATNNSLLTYKTVKCAESCIVKVSWHKRERERSYYINILASYNF